MNLSLEPELYVLNVGAKWKDIGSVTYGFLMQVNDLEAKVTNSVSSGGIPAEPKGGDAPTDGEPVQTPDIPDFSAAVAVMGLMVCGDLLLRRRI